MKIVGVAIIMKVGIIGGGSIGLLISCYLSEMHDVTIYVRRQAQKERINTKGLYIDKQPILHSVKASLLSELETTDCLIICVKQTEILNILPFIKKSKTVPTIFLQNGMGHIHMIQTLSQPSFVGVVEHGARRIDDNHVEHIGIGSIKIAAYSDEQKQLEQLADMLNQTQFSVKHKNNWYELLSEKLIVNAVINPLTALFRVQNSALIMNPYINRLAKMICDETAIALQLDVDKQWEHVQNIAQETGKNRSSMLSDIESNRPTEIEAITGYVLRLNNNDLPHTEFVYHSIRAMETQKGIRK